VFTTNEDGWVKVPVTPAEDARLWEEAFNRTHWNKVVKGNKDIAAYDHNHHPVIGVDQDFLGLRGELAVVKYLGLPTFDLAYWSYFATDGSHKFPEICRVVEVRRTNEPHSPLRIYKKDVKDDALNVKVYIPFKAENQQLLKQAPYVWVQGWVPAREGFYKGAYTRYEDLRLRYRLNDPETLQTAFEARLSLEVAA